MREVLFLEEIMASKYMFETISFCYAVSSLTSLNAVNDAYASY